MKKINKVLAVMLAAILTLFVFAGCNTKSQTVSSTESTTITITDHLGKEVTLPKDIKKIAVCDIYPLPSILSVFFDSAEKIVAMDDASMSAAKNSLLGELYPEISNAKTGFVKNGKVNTEELMKLSPDVVFYSASNTAVGEQLTKAGFKAVALSVNKWGYNAIDTLNNWISLFSQMFPKNDKAAKVKSYSDEAYKLVQDRVSKLSDSEKAKVFFLFNYTDAKIATSGNKFFGQWWADAIGAVNVGKDIDKENAAPVNMEQIYKWNPQMIFITNFAKAQPADLYGNTIGSFDWSAVDAVKNKNVYKMPLGMYRSYTPGVDTPITLLWMAKTTYPELFKDINIAQKTKDYYKTVFNITLTDEQADTIFNPKSNAASGVKN